MDRLTDVFRVDLETISDLDYSCHAWVNRSSGNAGGIIRFSGAYRVGSAGTEDALFIGWKIGQFCDISEPHRINGLIIDFRDLDYEWGDNLSVYRARRLVAAGGPVLVVVHPESWEAFAGQLGAEDLRTDIDQAAREVDDLIKRMR